ncbi:hypothetical protein GCM10009745_19530 [Kribbella yunnanensis]|uniref:Uncharacterized protein n=1 Tax=Kribbella yunnanensis TaxID=190194 RepID=A0ABN2GT49_9ACTN
MDSVAGGRSAAACASGDAGSTACDGDSEADRVHEDRSWFGATRRWADQRAGRDNHTKCRSVEPGDGDAYGT